MSEWAPNPNSVDVFAGEVIEVIRDSHPGIINGWMKNAGKP